MALLSGSYTVDAQSMARARTKMLRDPGNATGLQLHIPEQTMPEYKLPRLQEEITFVDGVEEEELSEDVDPQPEDVDARRWKGYLQEKGPSRLIVKIEEEREIQPLSDEIWALINGTNQKTEDSEPIKTQHFSKVEENFVQIPNKQVGGVLDKEQREAEKLRISKDVIRDESLITEDESDSYQKLMELFSRPVIKVPISEDENDGYVAFRVPKNPTSASVREGSRARFEIRKN